MKLVSVNIERDKHFDRLLPFLKEAAPDVLCVQELREPDVPMIAKAFGAESHVFTGTLRHRSNYDIVVGECVFSRLPIERRIQDFYVGKPGAVPREEEIGKSRSHVLTGVDVTSEGDVFRILTTHFTWTPDGKPDDEQRRNVRELMAVLKSQGEFILTGDFNAPRGSEIFAVIAEEYKDNIPTEYDWSLDLRVHRAADSIKADVKTMGLPGFMVDGLFTTPAFAASDVKLVAGVSDHCAVVAVVSKAT